jgi:hypothetical protein
MTHSLSKTILSLGATFTILEGIFFVTNVFCCYYQETEVRGPRLLCVVRHTQYNIHVHRCHSMKNETSVDRDSIMQCDKTQNVTIIYCPHVKRPMRRYLVARDTTKFRRIVLLLSGI